MNRRGFLGAFASVPIVTKTLARFRFYEPNKSNEPISFRFLVACSNGMCYDTLQDMSIVEGQSIVIAPENGELVISVCKHGKN